MTGAPTTAEWRIDWRMGGLRTLLPISVHSVALWTALELADEWALAWAMVVGVLINAVQECRVWIRERGIAHTLALIPGGIEIDTAAYYATRAWFGPRCTAAWLRRARQRILLFVVHGELSDANHAALRRHLKSLKLA
jgi:hypothetical protein